MNNNEEKNNQIQEEPVLSPIITSTEEITDDNTTTQIKTPQKLENDIEEKEQEETNTNNIEIPINVHLIENEKNETPIELETNINFQQPETNMDITNQTMEINNNLVQTEDVPINVEEKEQKRREKEEREYKKKTLEEEKKQKKLEEKSKKEELRRQKEEEKKKILEERKIQKKEQRERFRFAKKEIKTERKLQDIRNHTSFFRILLILITILAVAFAFITNYRYQKTIKQLKEQCTPLAYYEKETQLDIQSTLIKNLYKKVYTTMKEDYAQPEWNNTMKLYLAFRQIGEGEKYESNCNMFDNNKMEPYICEETNNTKPLAFHQDSLILEYKKLFGETANIKLDNIKLKNSCIGGYQYIPEREEFVQGKCTQQQQTNYKVTKELQEAIGKRNTIVLVEDVKYREGESMELPSYLKSGKYYYTFQLDTNYNFILISKVYESDY